TVVSQISRSSAQRSSESLRIGRDLIKTFAEPFRFGSIIGIGNLPDCCELCPSLLQQLTSSCCVALVEGENGRIEEQIRLQRVISASAGQTGARREELACFSAIAIMQLNVRDVAMLGSDHAFLAELPIQIDAFFVELPGRPEVALHARCDRLQMKGHLFQPWLLLSQRKPATLSGEHCDAFQIALTQRNAGKHAKSVYLTRHVLGGSGRADQVLGDACRLSSGTRPEGG